MSRYAPEDEARIRLQGFVRDWTHARLIDPAQGRSMEGELRVDLRRTGPMLRAGLALFTAIVIGAAIGLVAVTLDLDDAVPVGLFLAVCGAACFYAADLLASRYRLYRHGIEEMLAAAAVVLWSVAVAIVFSDAISSRDSVAFVASLAVAAAGSIVVYRRFGFRYAGIATIAAATLLPSPLNIPEPMKRVLAAAIAAAMLVVARAVRRSHPDDVEGDDAAVFAATAFVALYLSLNLQATPGWFGFRSAFNVPAWFRWATFAATWIVPAVALSDAVRQRERPTIDAAAAAGFVTLITTKPYFGIPRQPWDPIVFGVLLVTIAIVLKRWLASAGGGRAGFTAGTLTREESTLMRAIVVGSATVSPAAERPDAPPPSAFGGGRSGGGGGGADF